MILPLLLSALTAAPPIALSTRGGIDPMLPDSLRPAVQAAAEAEADPKRGPGNAKRSLEEALKALPEGSPEHMSLRLRVAATYLRQNFLRRTNEREEKRYADALSTFTRLDLTEPGLARWVKLAAAHTEGAPALIETGRQIPISCLVRGSGLTREAVQAAFDDAFKDTGFSLNWVPLRQAHFVLKLAATPVHGRRAIRVSLNTEGVHSGRVAWRDGLFRETQAAQPKEAVASSLRWLSRIGGRNIFFRWVGEHGLPKLLKNPHKHQHAHNHGAARSLKRPPKKKLPKTRPLPIQ